MTLNAIIANFQTFKIVDLLDIIIIAFLIYQLLGIINRTRAGQLAKGALLVMVVYLVANTLNMRFIIWGLVAPSLMAPHRKSVRRNLICSFASTFWQVAASSSAAATTS